MPGGLLHFKMHKFLEQIRATAATDLVLANLTVVWRWHKLLALVLYLGAIIFFQKSRKQFYPNMDFKAGILPGKHTGPRFTSN